MFRTLQWYCNGTDRDEGSLGRRRPTSLGWEALSPVSEKRTSQPLAGVDVLNSNRMSVHCCDRMDYDLSQKCDVNDTRDSCPDALISVVDGGYGLIVHDGGSSVIEISFCPWCGAKLPRVCEIEFSDQEQR